jgi:hypothetical protein
MRKIKNEILSTLNELQTELKNSTEQEQKSFEQAIIFVGIVFIISFFIC